MKFILSLLLSLCIVIQLKAKTRVTCIGASITYGYGLKDPLTQSYPAQLQKLLGNNYVVSNFGVSSATMLHKGDLSYWNTQAWQQALKSRPDIVFIDLGGNDSNIANRIHLNEYEHDYHEMIQSLVQLPSHPRVVLLLPIPAFLTDTNQIYDGKGITWCSLDAPTFESGKMTANIIGGAFHSPEWIQHLPLSSTIYSWALNNHWHTNFPLSQNGKLNFRYRILPHQYAYDAVKANRFGLEQSQPLIATPVKEKISLNTLAKIDNLNVFISIIKTSEDGKSMIIRLRSLSDKPEMVNLSFPSFKPKSIKTCIADETPGKEVGSSINMLPHGITSLIVE